MNCGLKSAVGRQGSRFKSSSWDFLRQSLENLLNLYGLQLIFFKCIILCVQSLFSLCVPHPRVYKLQCPCRGQRTGWSTVTFSRLADLWVSCGFSCVCIPCFCRRAGMRDRYHHIQFLYWLFQRFKLRSSGLCWRVFLWDKPAPWS